MKAKDGRWKMGGGRRTTHEGGKSYLWGLIQLQASKTDHVLLWRKLLGEKGTEF